MKAITTNIKVQMENFIKNADLQIENGNKAAGTRARKAALELAKSLKEFRKASVGTAK